MRPLFLDFPEQPQVALNDQEFMFGDSLLVAPKVWPFMDPYTVTLPAGDWYDFWTGEKASAQTLKLDPALDTLPVYVRAGSIIPEQPVVQNTDETPQGPLTLNVYPGPQCRGSLYVDDGNTLAYEHGDTFRILFSCNISPNHLDVTISAPDGSYPPWFHELQLNVFGLKGNVATVTEDSRFVTGWTQKSGIVTVPSVPWTTTAHHFRIDTEQSHP
jgi:alpha-glucosidase